MTDAKEFDEIVKRLREAGVPARHKPFGKQKLQCSEREWAMHLEWRAAYYRSHKSEWDMYRNRWLSRRKTS